MLRTVSEILAMSLRNICTEYGTKGIDWDQDIWIEGCRPTGQLRKSPFIFSSTCFLIWDMMGRWPICSLQDSSVSSEGHFWVSTLFCSCCWVIDALHALTDLATALSQTQQGGMRYGHSAKSREAERERVRVRVNEWGKGKGVSPLKQSLLTLICLTLSLTQWNKKGHLRGKNRSRGASGMFLSCQSSRNCNCGKHPARSTGFHVLVLRV